MPENSQDPVIQNLGGSTSVPDTTQSPAPVFRKGQIVVLKARSLPFRILDVYRDNDGALFYAWSKENYAHESMVRAVTPEEIAAAPSQPVSSDVEPLDVAGGQSAE